MLSNVRFKNSFRKSLLNQAIVVSLGLGTLSTAHAGPNSNFYFTNNTINIGANQATIGTDGVIEQVTITRDTNTTTLPDITLPLQGYGNGTHEIRVGLQASIGSTTLEVKLGVVEITADGTNITGFNLKTTGDAGYEKTYARVKLSGSVTVTSEFDTPATMIANSGNNITLDISTIIDEISATGDVANALNAFTSTGTVNYKLIINQLSGPDGAGAARLGHSDGVYSESDETTTWESATLGADFPDSNVANSTTSVVSGTLVIQEASSGGDTGGTGGDDEPTDVVSNEDTEALDQEADQVGNQVADEAASGQISDQTLQDTQSTTDKALEQSNALAAVDDIDTATPSSIINVVDATSNAAKTAGTAAGATSAGAGQELATKAKDILDNSANALEKLAASKADTTDPLSGDEVNKLQNALQNLAETTAEVAETSNSSDEIGALTGSLNKAFKAAEKLQTPIPSEVMDNLKSASVKVQFAVLKAELGLSETPTEQELTEAFNNPATKAKILKNTPTLPNANPISESEARANMLAFIQANRPTGDNDGGVTDAAVAGAIAASSAAAAAASSAAGSAAGAAAGGFAGGAGGGAGVSGLQALSDISGRAVSVLAAESNESTVTTDENTGTMTFNLSGTTFKVRPLAVKAVPSGVSASIDMLADGRVVIVTEEGVALEVAPTASDLISFAYGVEGAEFPLTMRDDGSFELALAGDDKFTGTFTYEDAGSTSSEACGDVTFAADATEVNAPSYAFTMTCENGDTQRIVPFVADSNFYETVDDADIIVMTDRNTGIISVTGIGLFKPSFFSTAPSDAEAEYQAQNADSNGIAFMPVDANGDGKMDYKIVSESRVQIMYAIP